MSPKKLQRMMSIIEEAESLEQKQANISLHINDIYEQAEKNGFCIKKIKAVIKRRKKEAERIEMENIIMSHLAPRL